MRFPLLIAGAFLCAVIAVSAAECPTIVGFADFLESNDTTAVIIEVVPVNSAAIDNLMIYRAENGNIQMIGDFDGCLLADPIVIDGPRQEPTAPTSTPRRGKGEDEDGQVGA